MLVALLAGTLSGCEMIGGGNSANPFWEMAEAIKLSLLDYQGMSQSERMHALDSFTDIVYLDRDDLPRTRQDIDKEMMAGANTDEYDVGVVASAFKSFCYLVDENVEAYLRRDEDQSVPLSEAVAMQVNDLTARLYSSGVGGMHALVAGLNELGFIEWGTQHPDYFGPMLAMQVRAAVEEVNIEERKTYTSSGQIDFQEEGGYLRELCKLLELDFDTVYPQLQELGQLWDEEKLQREAAEAAAAAQQAEADQALAATLLGEYYSASGWHLVLDEDGMCSLSSTTEDFRLTVGGWEVKNGLVIVADVLGMVTEEGIKLDEIHEPFILIAP